jgi:hypothetical protein
MFAAAQRKGIDDRLAGRDPVRLLCLTAVALVVAGLAAAPALGAQSGASPPPKSNLKPLWRGYPLNPGAGRVGSPSSPTQRPVPGPARHAPRSAPAANDTGGGLSPAVPLAAAGGFLLLGLIAALLVFQSRSAPLSSTKGAGVTRFRSRRSNRDEVRTVTAERESVAERIAAATAVPQPEEAEAPPATSMPVPPPGEAETAASTETPAATETTAATASTASTDDTASPDTSDSNERGGVGQHVETVLRAAEEAAAQLLEEARAKADEIRDGAELEAASRLEAAQAAASGLRSEAEQARAAAQRDATQQRAQMEQEVAARRADAEREASVISASAVKRYEELLGDTALAEERLRRLVGGLREVADRLDALLVAPAEATSANPTAGDGDVPQETTLVETLDPGTTKAGAGTR